MEMYRLIMNWIPYEKVDMEFESIREITLFVGQLHQKYYWIMSGSTWGWNDSKVYKDGKHIGDVSYNGRVWGKIGDYETELVDK